ncbi:tetratricopeptide repeat protein [Streptomyces sp. TLI_171]|uniref:tetratricopeptide repeat protein n=1 Tax=Streptomyces sp. TLI_171 TaxID=1938859 RepID=UPI000C40C51C|nr:tetratricopeptide repeat protein [Streptomyces sp. TLI_171]RKE21937.1 tetratricopeptide repeat protein [Streptomyces sp. TLI_171]
MTAHPVTDGLSDDERTLLAALAHLPAFFDMPNAVAATRTPAHLAETLVRSLTARGLLTTVPGRSTLHTLERAAAAEARGLTPPKNGAQVLGRYLDAQLDTVEQAARLLSPGHRPRGGRTRHQPCQARQLTSAQDAHAWMEATIAYLPVVLVTALEAREAAAALALVTALTGHEYLSRERDLYVSVHTLGLSAAKECQDQAAEHAMLQVLAADYLDRGHYDLAITHLQQALALATAGGDAASVARHTHGIGACHHAAGRWSAATTYLEEARKLLRPLGRTEDLVLDLLLLGSARTELDDPAAAIELLEEALQLLRTLPKLDPVTTGRALGYLGEAHSVAGGRPEATARISQALHEFSGAGAHHWTAWAMELHGKAYRRARDEVGAAIWFNASHAVYQALGRPADARRLAQRLNGAEDR